MDQDKEESKVKKINRILLSLCLSVILTGCNQADEKEETGPKDSTKGRYLETEIKAPANGKVYDMALMEDGRIRAAASDTSGLTSVYELEEDEESWKKIYDISVDAGENETASVESVVLSPDGSGTVYAYLEGEDEGSWSYYMLDEEGKTALSPYQAGEGEELSLLQLGEDGMLYGLRGSSIVRVHLKTGKSEEVVGSSAQAQYFGLSGDSLYVAAYPGEMKEFDLKTGHPVSEDGGLIKAVQESFISTMPLFAGLDYMPMVFSTGQEEDKVFYVTPGGIYCHTQNGNVTEQVVDASVVSLGTPDLYFKSMVVSETGDFYVLAADVSQETERDRMFKYVYSKDTPTVPEKEVKVYSLYEDPMLRKAALLYQAEHPDVYITYEVGTAANSALTGSDALRILSTEILAGKGPDLMILDGMPAGSYIEKGFLEDISKIAGEVNKEEGLYENITNAQMSDGRLYTIPLRFAMPVIQGTQKSLEAISDLKTFADEAERLRSEDPVTQIISTDQDNSTILAAKLYHAFSQSLIRGDGSLDEEKLNEFYTQLKRIYDTDDHTDSVTGEMTREYLESAGNITYDMMRTCAGKGLLNIGSIEDTSGVAMLVQAQKDTQTLSYQSLSDREAAVFVPMSVAGINSKGEQKEEAEEFLRFLLGKKAQSCSQSGGLPVNQEAMDEMLLPEQFQGIKRGYSDPEDPDEPYIMEIEGLPEEDARLFTEYVEKLMVPALSDDFIKEAVMEQVKGCMEGSVTVEQAVAQAAEKVKIHLAE